MPDIKPSLCRFFFEIFSTKNKKHMKNIQIFENTEFGSVRTIVNDNGDVLFNANDVCAALGHGNPRQALASHVDDPDVTKLDMGVVTGKKADGTDATQLVSTNFVNESGLYAMQGCRPLSWG